MNNKKINKNSISMRQEAPTMAASINAPRSATRLSDLEIQQGDLANSLNCQQNKNAVNKISINSTRTAIPRASFPYPRNKNV